MNMIEKRKQMRGQGGFTLIELLVVIAILGILAGVAVFAVGNLTDGANENACDIEASTIKTARAAAKASSLPFPSPGVAGDPTNPAAADNTNTYLDGNPKYFTVNSTAETATVAPAVAAIGSLPAGCTAPTLT